MFRPRSPVDTPSQRSARARRAALAKHAFEPDPMAIARDAKLAMFERAVDPDEQLDPEERRRRGNRLFRAWMTDLNYQSSRKRRGQTFRALELGPWLEEAGRKRTASPASVDDAVQEDRDAATSPASARS